MGTRNELVPNGGRLTALVPIAHLTSAAAALLQDTSDGASIGITLGTLVGAFVAGVWELVTDRRQKTLEFSAWGAIYVGWFGLAMAAWAQIDW